MNNRRCTWILAVVSAGALLLVACGGTETSGSTGGAGTTSSTSTGTTSSTSTGSTNSTSTGSTSSTGTGSSGTHYACDNRSSESTCADFWDGVTKDYATSHCDGVILEVPCPLDKAVGICKVVANNGETLTNTYYSDGSPRGPKRPLRTSAQR